MLVDDSIVVMNRREFEALPRLDIKVPHEPKPGLRWRRYEGTLRPGRGDWSMGEFVDYGEPGELEIAWRTIHVV